MGTPGMVDTVAPRLDSRVEVGHEWHHELVRARLVATRRYRLREYDCCFVGSEFVTWYVGSRVWAGEWVGRRGRGDGVCPVVRLLGLRQLHVSFCDDLAPSLRLLLLGALPLPPGAHLLHLSYNIIMHA